VHLHRHPQVVFPESVPISAPLKDLLSRLLDKSPLRRILLPVRACVCVRVRVCACARASAFARVCVCARVSRRAL